MACCSNGVGMSSVLDFQALDARRVADRDLAALLHTDLPVIKNNRCISCPQGYMHISLVYT
jgi:hypothetical protein